MSAAKETWIVRDPETGRETEFDRDYKAREFYSHAAQAGLGHFELLGPAELIARELRLGGYHSGMDTVVADDLAAAATRAGFEGYSLNEPRDVATLNAAVRLVLKGGRR